MQRQRAGYGGAGAPSPGGRLSGGSCREGAPSPGGRLSGGTGNEAQPAAVVPAIPPPAPAPSPSYMAPRWGGSATYRQPCAMIRQQSIGRSSPAPSPPAQPPLIASVGSTSSAARILPTSPTQFFRPVGGASPPSPSRCSVTGLAGNPTGVRMVTSAVVQQSMLARSASSRAFAFRGRSNSPPMRQQRAMVQAPVPHVVASPAPVAGVTRMISTARSPPANAEAIVATVTSSDDLQAKIESMTARISELERELALAKSRGEASNGDCIKAGQQSRQSSSPAQTNRSSLNENAEGTQLIKEVAVDIHALKSAEVCTGSARSNGTALTERERWGEWLQEFEAQVTRGIELATGDQDTPQPVQRQRLNALSNALKQGLFSVGQATIDQDVQGLRQSASSQLATRPAS